MGGPEQDFSGSGMSVVNTTIICVVMKVGNFGQVKKISAY
jgi:hypothetical protein